MTISLLTPQKQQIRYGEWGPVKIEKWRGDERQVGVKGMYSAKSSRLSRMNMGYLHLCHALIQTHIIHSFIHSASIHLALLGCSTPILRIVCEYKINHIAPSASLVGQAQIVETTGGVERSC